MPNHDPLGLIAAIKQQRKIRFESPLAIGNKDFARKQLSDARDRLLARCAELGLDPGTISGIWNSVAYQAFEWGVPVKDLGYGRFAPLETFDFSTVLLVVNYAGADILWLSPEWRDGAGGVTGHWSVKYNFGKAPRASLRADGEGKRSFYDRDVSHDVKAGDPMNLGSGYLFKYLPGSQGAPVIGAVTRWRSPGSPPRGIDGLFYGLARVAQSNHVNVRLRVIRYDPKRPASEASALARWDKDGSP